LNKLVHLRYPDVRISFLKSITERKTNNLNYELTGESVPYASHGIDCFSYFYNGLGAYGRLEYSK